MFLQSKQTTVQGTKFYSLVYFLWPGFCVFQGLCKKDYTAENVSGSQNLKYLFYQLLLTIRHFRENSVVTHAIGSLSLPQNI